MNTEQTKMGRIIAKAWSDAKFKSRLLANPAAVLKEEGVSIPDGVSVRVLENTDKLFHFVLPLKQAELADEDLDKATGGFFNNGRGFRTSPSTFEIKEKEGKFDLEKERIVY